MAQVDPVLRQAIHGVVNGRCPWPLFLHGPAGRGKTCAALCLLDFAGGLYWTLPDFLALLVRAMKGQETRRAGGEVRTVHLGAIWDEIGSTNLLVVDEVGSRQVTDHHYESLKRLLDLREYKPHVVISNHDLDALERLYDDRITSRLAAGTVVQLLGPDRRLAGADTSLPE